MSKKFRFLTILLAIGIVTVSGFVASWAMAHKNELIYVKSVYWDLALWGGPKEGKAEIEFLSPKSNQLFAPGSTIEVEVSIRMNGREIKGVYILADGIPKKRFDEERTQMQFVSREQDVYRYRYTIENAPEVGVYSGVQITVVDTTNAQNYNSVGYLVRKIWPITITAPHDGETFSRKTRITIEMGPRPAGAFDNFDKYIIYINGKYHNNTSGRNYWLVPTPGTHSIEIVRSFDEIELARSAPVKIHVK